MALQKQRELKNGIIVNYHRVVSINKITNSKNIYEIASYISQKQRQIEEEYQNLQKKSSEELTIDEKEKLDKGINVFIETQFLDKEYNESIDIKNVYNYLKTTEEFKNAEDV